MKINNLKLETKNSSVIISADILVGRTKNNVFFEVDSKYKQMLTPDIMSFMPSSYLISLKNREEVISDYPISPEFTGKALLIREILSKWNPDLSGQGKIISSGKYYHKPSNDKNIGMFFSGGVDSFYTYLKNKKSDDDKITHFIFVHGFDVELGDIKLFETTHRSLLEICSKEKIELIVVRTNLKDFVDKYVDWHWAHGACLASVALLLRDSFKKVYISSSNSWDELFPLGSHPFMDKLWAIDDLEITHDGNESSRLQKVKFIADNPIVRKYLRVCFNNFGGKYNCGECEKCLRTMVQLKVWDSLEFVETFKNEINIKTLSNLPNMAVTQRHLGKCLNELVRQNKYAELQDAIMSVIVRPKSKKENIIKSLDMFFRGIDDRYFRGQVFLRAYKIKKRLSRIGLFGRVDKSDKNDIIYSQ